MKYYFIVLFMDKTMLPASLHPTKSSFANGARFFKVHENVTILEIGEWYASGNPAKNREHGKPTIVEIEGKA